MHKSISMFALLAFATSGLVACPPPVVVPVADPGDGGSTEAASSSTTCATYCDHARRLGCREAAPTAKGATCETVCTNAQTASYAHRDLRCGAEAKTCAALSACGGD